MGFHCGREIKEGNPESQNVSEIDTLGIRIFGRRVILILTYTGFFTYVETDGEQNPVLQRWII
jgi:hypothetical protein